jgi:hypothetical protein
MTQWGTVGLKIDVRQNANTFEVLENLNAKVRAGQPTGSSTALPQSTATIPTPTPAVEAWPKLEIPQLPGSPLAHVPLWAWLAGGGALGILGLWQFNRAAENARAMTRTR